MVFIGLAITLVVAWAAWALNSHNEHRLLEEQTRQAGAVLSSTILGIEAPLATVLQIERATGGDPGQFQRYMAATTGGAVCSCRHRCGPPMVPHCN